MYLTEVLIKAIDAVKNDTAAVLAICLMVLVLLQGWNNNRNQKRSADVQRSMAEKLGELNALITIIARNGSSNQ